MNYYNEFDPFAAAWLEQLIAAGHIAPGFVDTRSIEDVTPYDLKDFTQCHFFAGIGVWSYALRNAGWSDDTPVWTGSCPCQPFSSAGKGAGFDDERHLWPHFHYLIEQCRPSVVFGEQVASKDGLAWLDLVSADLEATGYAFGAADLCAAGVGAPHIRQRSFWVADTDGCGRQQFEGLPKHARILNAADDASQRFSEPRDLCASSSGMADSDHTRSQGHGRHVEIDGPQGWEAAERHVGTGGVDAGGALPTNGYWRDADWLSCRDGKWRPVEPGASALVNGATNRVGRLRGYGNAIVAPVAQAFIESYMNV